MSSFNSFLGLSLPDKPAPEQLIAFAKSAPLPLFVRDDTGRLLFLHAGSLTRLGLRFEQIADSSWMAFVHPEDRDRVHAHMQAAISEKAAYYMHSRFGFPGFYRCYASIALPVFCNDGRAYYLGTFQEVGSYEADKKIERLSERERQVLKCLVAGYTNEQISRELIITETTVKNHLAHIFKKLGVKNRTQAALLAHNLKLLEP